MTVTTFRVADLPQQDAYKLLTGLVVPRPIAWVGSRSRDGTDNLAPFSFFNAVSGDPPTVVLSPGNDRRKDTRDNILATGVFTLNAVSADLVERMNATAASVDADASEFDLADLTVVESTLIAAPRVAECVATMECRMTQHLPIGRPDGGNMLIIAEVLAFHIDGRLLDGTRIDQAALRAVGRHAGHWFSSATDLFELVRPD